MNSSYIDDKLDKTLFLKYRDLIYKTSGIFLSDKKITLLSNRLRKRLKERNFSTYKEYYNYLTDHPEDKTEMTEMIDVVTTNVTHFFRNPKQLEIFQDIILKEIEQRGYPIRLLSAGCSTGEEPYTLSLIIKEHYPKLNFHIDAVDISSTALDVAKKGIYTNDKIIDHVSKSMLLHFFQKESENEYAIKNELKQHVSFTKMNIVRQPFTNTYDIIFCRNVVIYFDKPTKENVYNNIHKALKPDGYFFVGHSEGLINNTKFRYVQPGIYTKL